MRYKVFFRDVLLLGLACIAAWHDPSPRNILTLALSVWQTVEQLKHLAASPPNPN